MQCSHYGCPGSPVVPYIQASALYFQQKLAITILPCRPTIWQQKKQLPQCDIERKKKHREICTPAQYIQLVQKARPTSPYKVHYVSRDFFKDISEVRVYTSIRPGRKAGDSTDLQCLKYLPTGEIHWKLQYTDDWQQRIPSRRTSATSAGVPWNLD